MTSNTMLRSPLHALIESRKPIWCEIAGTPAALHFGNPDAERDALATLALCDLSALPKQGYKGPGTADWLNAQGVTLPQGMYDTLPLTDGGIVVRIGSDEFLLESGVTGQTVADLQTKPVSAGVYDLARADATILIGGTQAKQVMLQTCGVNFAVEPAGRVVYSRVAGVSAAILPQPSEDIDRFRLWVDYSYAPYLWRTLVEIAEELGGRVVGAAAVYPQLAGLV